jgi:hypothetical protein
MYGTSSFNIKKSFLPLPSLTKRLYRFYHFERSPKKYFAILESTFEADFGASKQVQEEGHHIIAAILFDLWQCCFIVYNSMYRPNCVE